jgi:methionyl aminopeptidase
MIARAHDIEGLKEAGRRFGVILDKVADAAKAGVSTRELDALSEKLIRDGGDVPSFKGYRPEGAPRAFPATLCISVNDEVVHGLPGDRVLKDGDIVSLDLGLTHDGYVMDSAVTIPVGGMEKVSKEAQNLMRATQASLESAILAARVGNRTGDISHATEEAFKGTGFSVVKQLGGHGVGAEVHEEPFISNAGHPGTGPEIVPGMVLALEPIANVGKAGVMIAPDGFTYRTKDGSLSAHFEHTILVLEDETIVLTRRPSELK